MADTFAILALCRKRAHLAGEIAAAQKVLSRQRETLATLDAVIRLFEPAINPDLIPSIRPCTRLPVLPPWRANEAGPCRA